MSIEDAWRLYTTKDSDFLTFVALLAGRTLEVRNQLVEKGMPSAR